MANLVVVKFKKNWGPYNGGETAGFTEEQLAEKINVGSGPLQEYRIPRDVFERPDAEPPAAPISPPAPTPPVDQAAPEGSSTPPAPTP